MPSKLKNLKKPTRIRNSTCRGSYVGPLTLALWNARSLWARDNTETIHFMLQLARSHAITVLTETRESKERLVFLETKLSVDVEIFSGRLD